MNIPIVLLNEQAKLPAKATEYAAGWDVVATEVVYTAPDRVICKLGFRLGLPEHYKLICIPRSSITNTNWVLQNSPGLGDPDFFGEYQLRFRAFPDGVKRGYADDIVLTYPEFPYKVGDRVGQICVEPIVKANFDENSPIIEIGKRDPAGYGTTGK